MPSPVLRSAIRSRIRSAVQQPNAGGLFDDATLNDLIREGVNAVYDALVDARGTHTYSTVRYLNTVSGVATVDLPGNFYKLVALLINQRTVPLVEDVDPSSGEPIMVPDGEQLTDGWREIDALTPRELDVRRNRDGRCPGNLVYSLTEVQPSGPAQLRFYPTPRAAFGLQLLYLPVCAHTEVAEEVTYDLINGWEAAVIAYCCEEITATQEDSTTTYWRAKKTEQFARIAALADDRDQAQPFRMADRRDWTTGATRKSGDWDDEGPWR